MERSRGRKRTRRRIALFSLLGLGIVVVVLAAAVAIPIFTHESSGGSGQSDPAGFVNSVTAEGADSRTRTLSASAPDGDPIDLAQLTPGDRVRIAGSGFDASIGIYVSFCAIPDSPEERPSPCLGGIPEGAVEGEASEVDPESPPESAWITDNWAWRAFATHQYTDHAAGSFEVTLSVPPAQGESLDCTVRRCAIFTRADHTALNERVQDLYLPIAFSGTEATSS